MSRDLWGRDRWTSSDTTNLLLTVLCANTLIIVVLMGVM